MRRLQTARETRNEITCPARKVHAKLRDVIRSHPFLIRAQLNNCRFAPSFLLLAHFERLELDVRVATHSSRVSFSIASQTVGRLQECEHKDTDTHPHVDPLHGAHFKNSTSTHCAQRTREKKTSRCESKRIECCARAAQVALPL